MPNIVERKLVFHDDDGKRFIADDVEQVQVSPNRENYNDNYLVHLHDGDELKISESKIMQAYENPQYIYVPVKAI